MRWFPVLLVVLTQYAAAANNFDFTVEGTITASSCVVTADNGGIVSLPPRATKFLSAATATTGSTLFQIKLDKCSAQSRIYFQQDLGTISPDGRLLNMAVGGAKNVELQVLNAQGQPMNLAAGKGLQNDMSAEITSNPDVSVYKFYVQYYATAPATAGRVTSSVTFIVESF